MKTGIIVFAHGSKLEAANRAVEDVVNEVASEGQYELASPAFLELGRPDLPQAVASQAAQGAEHIIVIPYFLTPGKHLTRDLPRIVRELQVQHPAVSIEITPSLDGHPALRQIILERAQKAIECYPTKSLTEPS